ncbi:MAG TPA: TetR/AcrR family transcriptional regulator [Ktedonobacteraceae bacterium]|jgi:AcrR family transcriptional regulator
MAARAGLDHELILQAAVKLADEHGLDHLTMATLAARLNVRTPTLYHYFGGLPGIQRSLALSGLREMTGSLGRAVMGKSGDAAIIALAYALRDFALEHPGAYEATLRSSEGADAEWQAAGREVVDIGVRALSFYKLTLDDALHTVRILRSIVHGWVSLNSAGGFALPLDIDETFRRLLDVLLLYLHTYVIDEHKEA